MAKAVIVTTALSSGFLAFSFSETSSRGLIEDLAYINYEDFGRDRIKEKGVVFYESVNRKLPWLQSFYESSKTADTAKEIKPIISGIRNLFSEKKYHLVNEILLEMDLSKLSHTAMLSFVSVTFPARHKLDAWSLTAEKVKIALSEDGLDSEQIMQGLI